MLKVAKGMPPQKRVGDKSYHKFITKCILNDWIVCEPRGDCARYDCVIDRGNGLERVQVKTGRYESKKGIISFPVASVGYSSIDGGHFHTKRTTYVGQIDYFGVYCFTFDTCYLVPVDIVGINSASLRILEVKNKQTRNIRWAKDFEI